MIHQKISTQSNQSGAHNQPEQILQEGSVFGFRLFFLHLIRVFQSLTDGDNHVDHKNRQQDQAQRPGELSYNVCGYAVNGGAEEEENHRHLHGFGIDRARVDRNGNGGDQSGVADDGTDGVAVSHSALTQHGAGGGNHNLRQSGADGNHCGADNNVRQMEPTGNAGGSVDKPVAAFDQQHQSHSKQQNRNNHGGTLLRKMYYAGTIVPKQTKD